MASTLLSEGFSTQERYTIDTATIATILEHNRLSRESEMGEAVEQVGDVFAWNTQRQLVVIGRSAPPPQDAFTQEPLRRQYEGTYRVRCLTLPGFFAVTIKTNNQWGKEFTWDKDKLAFTSKVGDELFTKLKRVTSANGGSMQSSMVDLITFTLEAQETLRNAIGPAEVAKVLENLATKSTRAQSVAATAQALYTAAFIQDHEKAGLVYDRQVAHVRSGDNCLVRGVFPALEHLRNNTIRQIDGASLANAISQTVPTPRLAGRWRSVYAGGTSIGPFIPTATGDTRRALTDTAGQYALPSGNVIPNVIPENLGRVLSEQTVMLGYAPRIPLADSAADSFAAFGVMWAAKNGFEYAILPFKVPVPSIGQKTRQFDRDLDVTYVWPVAKVDVTYEGKLRTKASVFEAYSDILDKAPITPAAEPLLITYRPGNPVTHVYRDILVSRKIKANDPTIRQVRLGSVVPISFQPGAIKWMLDGKGAVTTTEVRGGPQRIQLVRSLAMLSMRPAGPTGKQAAAPPTRLSGLVAAKILTASETPTPVPTSAIPIFTRTIVAGNILARLLQKETSSEKLRKAANLFLGNFPGLPEAWLHANWPNKFEAPETGLETKTESKGGYLGNRRHETQGDAKMHGTKHASEGCPQHLAERTASACGCSTKHASAGCPQHLAERTASACGCSTKHASEGYTQHLATRSSLACGCRRVTAKGDTEGEKNTEMASRTKTAGPCGCRRPVTQVIRLVPTDDSLYTLARHVACAPAASCLPGTGIPAAGSGSDSDSDSDDGWSMSATAGCPCGTGRPRPCVRLLPSAADARARLDSVAFIPGLTGNQLVARLGYDHPAYFQKFVAGDAHRRAAQRGIAAHHILHKQWSAMPTAASFLLPDTRVVFTPQFGQTGQETVASLGGCVTQGRVFRAIPFSHFVYVMDTSTRLHSEALPSARLQLRHLNHLRLVQAPVQEKLAAVTQVQIPSLPNAAVRAAVGGTLELLQHMYARFVEQASGGKRQPALYFSAQTADYIGAAADPGPHGIHYASLDDFLSKTWLQHAVHPGADRLALAFGQLGVWCMWGMVHYARYGHYARTLEELASLPPVEEDGGDQSSAADAALGLADETYVQKHLYPSLAKTLADQKLLAERYGGSVLSPATLHDALRPGTVVHFWPDPEVQPAVASSVGSQPKDCGPPTCRGRVVVHHPGASYAYVAPYAQGGGPLLVLRRLAQLVWPTVGPDARVCPPPAWTPTHALHAARSYLREHCIQPHGSPAQAAAKTFSFQFRPKVALDRIDAQYHPSRLGVDTPAPIHANMADYVWHDWYKPGQTQKPHDMLLHHSLVYLQRAADKRAWFLQHQ